MKTKEAIQDFTDLKVWQKSHKIALITYSSTSTFPTSERFGLVSQMRRASVSVSSNIAEGFGRRQPKDKKHFYNMALASTYELRNQAILAKDLEFMTAADFDTISRLAVEVQKMLFAISKHDNMKLRN